MLYLSVSSLRDYLACPKRFWWRSRKKSQPEINEYVLRGQIIHNAIETCDTLEDALEFAGNKYAKDFLSAGIPQDVEKMLYNYYEKIEPVLEVRNPDNIELMFKVKWNSNTFIVGKIDRISSDKTKLYDWKTSFRTPSTHTLHDPQFYVYQWAISKLYDVEPEVYYGHLMSGKLFRVDINEKMWYNIKYLINEVSGELQKRKYFPRVPGYQCESCFFKTVCWKEFKK